jgi:N-methylhydantoinase A
LSPSFLLGGDLLLKPELAYSALSERVARPLRMDVINGAVGVLRIAIASIAEALRAATVEKGLDPREMTLVAFGGAGPMFACEVARHLEIGKIVVPPAAGLLSSLGLLLAEPLHDSVRTILRNVENVNPRELERIFGKMEGNGANLLRVEGVEERDVRNQRLVDVRYVGQSYELSVPLLGRIVTRSAVRSAVRDFHRMHQAKYGYYQPDRPVEIVNVRSYCRGKAGTIPRVIGTFSREQGLPERRRVWFTDEHGIECQVFRRKSLFPGRKGRGPCVIEDYDSTLVIPPRAGYVIDRNGSASITI